MNKKSAKTRLANVAARQGLKVQMKAGRSMDRIRILNARGQVVASGTVKLDASRQGYVDADVEKIVSQIQTKLNASKVPATRNLGTSLNSGRRKMNAGCHGRKRLNSADDVEAEDFMQDDAEFVDDVESVVTDDQGNEVVVDEMLVVQDPETKEIALFVPTEEDETIPENVEVIGEVTAADDTVLDSSRRKLRAGKRRK